MRVLSLFILFYAFVAPFSGVQASERLPVESAQHRVEQWDDFCSRNPTECKNTFSPKKTPWVFTPRRAQELKRINKWVNAHVKYVSDQEHWGVPDHWDIPLDGKGDCEDYALLKRKMLIKLGWPSQVFALAMTAAMDLPRGDDHMILLVKTKKGEYVLDNRSSDILKTSQIPYNKSRQLGSNPIYVFMQRQMYEDEGDPNMWVFFQIPDDLEEPALVAKVGK